MTREAMLALVRQLIADEQATGFNETEGGNLEFPDGTVELLNYMDRAADAVSERGIGAKDAHFLKSLEVTDGMPIPKLFVCFAGCVPVRFENGTFEMYGYRKMKVQYFARLPVPSSFSADEQLPYRAEDAKRIAALAAIYALNKHEFDVSQDIALLGADRNADSE